MREFWSGTTLLFFFLQRGIKCGIWAWHSAFPIAAARRSRQGPSIVVKVEHPRSPIRAVVGIPAVVVNPSSCCQSKQFLSIQVAVPNVTSLASQSSSTFPHILSWSFRSQTQGFRRRDSGAGTQTQGLEFLCGAPQQTPERGRGKGGKAGKWPVCSAFHVPVPCTRRTPVAVSVGPHGTEEAPLSLPKPL